MPTNKDALKRYKIIHNLLRRGHRYKSIELADECSKRLNITVSQRTIQQDLKDLAQDFELGFYLPIEKERQHREVFFYYSEIPNSIFPALELEKDEINALLFYAKTVQQYRAYPMFGDISEAIKKVVINTNISPNLKRLFDENSSLLTENHFAIRGTELIVQLLSAIHRQNVIEVDYKKFTISKVKTYILKPILLKEDKHMWYVVSERESKQLITLALDRIIRMSITDKTFKKIDFDYEDYYRHSFGITVTKDAPQEVTISFTAKQGNYIKTLPIHSTQEIIKDTEQELVITVIVKPSYEFYAKILSYGPDATIISPFDVREKVRALIEGTLSKY